MAVLGDVCDHRLERLRVAVAVVLVDEHDAPEAAQVVKRLLKRQSEATSEFQYEDERPLHFVMIAVSHNLRRLLDYGAKIRLFPESSKFWSCEGREMRAFSLDGEEKDVLLGWMETITRESGNGNLPPSETPCT